MFIENVIYYTCGYFAIPQQYPVSWKKKSIATARLFPPLSNTMECEFQFPLTSVNENYQYMQNNKTTFFLLTI